MRKNIYCLFFCAGLHGIVYGQACLQNGNFANVCSGTIAAPNGQCPTWSNPCGGGWIRSNGSPQMVFYNDGPHTGYYAFMWSTGWTYNSIFYNQGEGMFTPYSFQANRSYDVSIRISTSNTNGTVYVYAANGLTQSPYYGNCGDPVPTISQKQLIGSYAGFTNGWLTLNFSSFVSNANYSQIWIYPLGAPVNIQYNLAVIDVRACLSCSETIIYNNGVVPYVESRAGYIYAGSSAGSGGTPPVTVAPNQTTNLFASKEINLVSEFEAVVTTGSFLARILPCSVSSRQAYLDSLNVDLYESNEGSGGGSTDKLSKAGVTMGERAEFSLYPNPSTGQFMIKLPDKDKEKTVIVEVADQSGRFLFSRTTINLYGKNEFSLDLSQYKTGYYFVTIKTNKNITTLKAFVLE